MAASKFVAVRTTLEKASSATTLAEQIVEGGLAACVQYYPVRSVYRWKGTVEKASEFVLEAKTTDTQAKELMEFIRARHPYDVPELVVTPISSGSDDYLAWIGAETKRKK